MRNSNQPPSTRSPCTGQQFQSEYRTVTPEERQTAEMAALHHQSLPAGRFDSTPGTSEVDMRRLQWSEYLYRGASPAISRDFYQQCTSYVTLQGPDGVKMPFQQHPDLSNGTLTVKFNPSKDIPSRAGSSRSNPTQSWAETRWQRIKGADPVIGGTLTRPTDEEAAMAGLPHGRAIEPIEGLLRTAHTVRLPKFDPATLDSAIKQDAMGRFTEVAFDFVPVDGDTDGTGGADTKDWVTQAMGLNHRPTNRRIPDGSIPVKSSPTGSDGGCVFDLPRLPMKQVGIGRRFRMKLNPEQSILEDTRDQGALDLVNKLHGGETGLEVEGISSVLLEGRVISNPEDYSQALGHSQSDAGSDDEVEEIGHQRVNFGGLSLNDPQDGVDTGSSGSVSHYEDTTPHNAFRPHVDWTIKERESLEHETQIQPRDHNLDLSVHPYALRGQAEEQELLDAARTASYTEHGARETPASGSSSHAPARVSQASAAAQQPVPTMGSASASASATPAAPTTSRSGTNPAKTTSSAGGSSRSGVRYDQHGKAVGAVRKKGKGKKPGFSLFG